MYEEAKNEMTSLDIRFLVRELRKIITGGFIRKIYQYGDSRSKNLFFEIFVPNKGAFWLYMDKNKIFLTKHKKPAPQEPPSFCMFLRKHLMNKKIKNITQAGFDRIVEIETEQCVFVAELFHSGNFILCDSLKNIIMPLEIQKWKDREIKPKIPYRYPPKPLNPFAMDIETFISSFFRTEKKLIAYLASSLGFGSVYAQEICARCGVDGNILCKEIKTDDIVAIYNTIQEIDKEFSPCVYENFVSPFPLKIYGNRDVIFKPSFSEALDEYFSKREVETVKESIEKQIKEEKEKLERIVKQQDEALERWKKIEKQSREMGDRIYSYYSVVEGVIEGIRKAKESGLSWTEIKEKISQESSPEAEAIKEIREGDNVVVLNLGGIDVEIDITKTPEENAAKYYEDAKWAKKKLEGLVEAKSLHEKKLEETQEERKKLETSDFEKFVFAKEKESITVQKSQEPEQKKPRRKWYEKFRWFLSSDGFLVVGGKDANQNEMLIKKHTEPKDFVFHAATHGAAFVVIKTQGMEVPDETKKEAAEFAAAHSKAWSMGLATIDVYCVRREQVSKSPPSGEYLPKGSFMIYGEREWYRDIELKLAIGVKIDRENNTAKVLSGPVMAMRKNSDYFITIKPGFKKSHELARTIKDKILIRSSPEDRFLIEKIPLDEFQVVIPSGTGDIAEYV